jgi:hypothetical protein
METIKGNVFYNSCHASIEFDQCSIFKHLGMKVVKGNLDRSHEERPAVKGYNEDQDYGDTIRNHVDNLACVEEDFSGCDMVFMINPADFQHRAPHFAKFRPTCMFLNGQWVPRQLDELASQINGQMDRGEQPRIWVAVYTKVEENYLRPRIHTELQSRIHHIRFAKKFEDYYPWLTGTQPTPAPERKPFIYTTCNDIQNRGNSCNWTELQEIRRDLPHVLSGRNTNNVGGQGLIPFDQLRQQMRECSGYLGVPCWPAPLVLNIVEAMMCGAPVAFYDNGQGVAEEGIFNDEVGCCSSEIEGLRSFLKRCLSDHSFREEQSQKSLQRASEFFDFNKQVEKWRVLFKQMSELWK